MRRSLGLFGSLLVLVAAVVAGPGAPAAAQGGAPVAAQGGCVPDAEPNDQPSGATVLTGALCLEGTLAEGDQDLLTWEVTPTDTTTRWTFRLSGVEDALTSLELLRITSEPGIEPPTPDTTPLLTMTSGPDDTLAAPREDVLLPVGRYVVAVFRSNPQDDLPDASIAYRVAIEPGTPLPATLGTEPDDDAASGAPATGAFLGSGDLGGTDDHIAWTPDTTDPDQLWQVTLQAPLGVSVSMTVGTPDGLGWTTVLTQDGRAVVHDLAPDPAGYDIALAHVDESPLAYVVRAAPEPADGPPADAEPDDRADRARPIDPGRPVARGRLATVGDADVWRFTVDQSQGARQLDVRLIAPDGPARQLCLSDAAETTLQCRQGAGGVVLSDLLLPSGDYLLRVSGDADPDAGYVLRLDPTSAPVADFETEPDDTPAVAVPFAASTVMRGRAGPGDTDMFRLGVTGEPQLWEVEARGTALDSLEWVDGEGYALGTAVVSDDHTTATLHDLYLVPGDHRLKLTASGGDYTITATPMGPPDPDAEREPNDDVAHANVLSVGDTRTGRLRSRDTDWYRFSLAATEHVVIDVDVPDDGSVVMELDTGGQTIVETRGTDVAQDIHYDALLPAGEYAIWLAASQPSDAPYRLVLRRADPFTRDGDLEPDDTALTARPIPPTGVVTGSGWGIGDQDWYLLPTQPGGAFSAEVEGDVAFVELVQGDLRVPLRQVGTGPAWTTDEALAGDQRLVVTALGDYTLRLPDLAVAPAPDAAGLVVELALPTDRVAAWWDAGQRLDGLAHVTNASSEPLDVSLDGWTSHYDWRVALDGTTRTLAPGATTDVPLTVDIQPEAWAGTPVAVAVRATATTGDARPTTTLGWATVTPTGDAEPVGAHRAWAVPDALLGGLDVAAVVMGGTSDGIDPAGEALLHDGSAVGGGTMTLYVTDPPSPTTVDLAGDDALPVAGIVVDPASGLDSLSEKPRGFDLWLSEDGTDWTLALSGEVSPLGIEQAFPLGGPQPARYARLAVTSTWSGTLLGDAPVPAEAQVAEWKVIAAPGVDPAVEPRDIADPALGGHVVSSDPLLAELPEWVTGILDDDRTRAWTYPPAGGEVSWVVGFLHDRAAQVTQLGWIDPDGSDPATRARRVALEVSTESPLGPWRPLGTWRLERAADGSVTPFVLETPTWARYVRFTAPGPKVEGAAWELPGRLSVLERPTDDTYRSILAEWGQSRPDGPYELTIPDDGGPRIDDPDVGEGPHARPLDPGVTARGRVAIGSDADEYRIEVPDGQRSISVAVGGDPVVGVTVRLLDPDGADVPLRFGTDASTGGDAYQADVTPGTTYRLRVEQPPFSAVMMYDTSLSIAGYWRPIRQGLMAFAGDVVRGRDRVMIIPFGADRLPLLRDWSDDAWQLQTALEGSIADGDSATESSVRNALKVLAARQGARAILLVTDGESTSFAEGPDMWRGLARQRPLVFTVHIGGTAGTSASTHLLQDLAASSAGVYTYVRTQDEMDRAFDRMATTLRRPATYRVAYATSEEALPPPEPGGLSVVTETGPDGQPTAAPVDPRIALEIILDTSGSMRRALGSTTRIAAAKDVLTRLVREDLPEGIPVALRVFRAEAKSCETELAVPLGPLDRETLATTIEELRFPKDVRTPLAAAIARVADDLADVTGPRIVVVVSDGRESCGGDPEAAVKALRAQGFDVTVNVVGLGLGKEDRKRIRRLAALGGGTYYDAKGAGDLDDAIGTAVSAPYEVRDAGGTVVARGTVNGPTLRLPPGTYEVTVLVDPTYTFEAIVLGAGETATLTLPAAPVP